MAKYYRVNNVATLFYTIGEVARRVNRSHLTIRKWERDGVIPPATFRTESNRRLYSEKQVMLLESLIKKYKMRQGRGIPDGFKEEIWAEFNK